MGTKKIKIKDVGHIIYIPGLQPIRTPCILDISRLDEDIVYLTLEQAGIKNYKIITKEEKKPVLKEKVKEYKKDISNDIQELKEKINLILDLVKSPKYVFQDKEMGREEEKIKIAKKIKEEEETFIPSIDIGGMSIKGDSPKTVKGSSSVGEVADLLRKVSRNKLKK